MMKTQLILALALGATGVAQASNSVAAAEAEAKERRAQMALMAKMLEATQQQTAMLMQQNAMLQKQLADQQKPTTSATASAAQQPAPKQNWAQWVLGSVLGIPAAPATSAAASHASQMDSKHSAAQNAAVPPQILAMDQIVNSVPNWSKWGLLKGAVESVMKGELPTQPAYNTAKNMNKQAGQALGLCLDALEVFAEHVVTDSPENSPRNNNKSSSSATASTASTGRVGDDAFAEARKERLAAKEAKEKEEARIRQQQANAAQKK